MRCLAHSRQARTTLRGLGSEPRDPLTNSMATLAFSQVHSQGAASPACVGLSRSRNAESGLGWKPLRARPGAPCLRVVALAKGAGHCRRTTPRAGSARLAQSRHRISQRILSLVRCLRSAPGFPSIPATVPDLLPESGAPSLGSSRSHALHPPECQRDGRAGQNGG